MNTNPSAIAISISISSVCHAFNASAVGTRADTALISHIVRGIEAHDPATDRAPGQHFIMLEASALALVSSGVGRRTEDPNDYVVRVWRGRADAFLRRERAEAPTGVACIVYTRAAYGEDPDVTLAELEALGAATHVVVAVLAFAGPACPPAPWTFARNLAGANNEEASASGDEIRAKARAVAEYHGEWCVVAD